MNTQPLDEGRPVGVVPDDWPSLDPTADNMVQSARRIEAGVVRDGRGIPQVWEG